MFIFFIMQDKINCYEIILHNFIIKHARIFQFDSLSYLDTNFFFNMQSFETEYS